MSVGLNHMHRLMGSVAINSNDKLHCHPSFFILGAFDCTSNIKFYILLSIRLT